MNKPTIMIVEDEALIAFGVRKGMLKLGYEVSGPVASGEEAVSMAKNEAPDLILMDIMLNGEINGIEAAREIRALNNIPIIFLTGYCNQEIRKKAEEVGYEGYFIKPVNSGELKEPIEAALKKYGFTGF